MTSPSEREELLALDEAGLNAAVRECARITAPEISDEEFERIKAMNSFRYQNTRREMSRAIRAYLRASSPDGAPAVREALEPFASLGGPRGSTMAAYHDLPADTVIYENSGAVITAGDVRRARSALSAPPVAAEMEDVPSVAKDLVHLLTYQPDKDFHCSRRDAEELLAYLNKLAPTTPSKSSDGGQV